MPTKEAWESYNRFPRVVGGTVYVPPMDEDQRDRRKSLEEMREEFEQEQLEFKKENRGRTFRSYESRYPGRKPLGYKPKSEQSEVFPVLPNFLDTISEIIHKNVQRDIQCFKNLFSSAPFLCPRKRNFRKLKFLLANYELSRHHHVRFAFPEDDPEQYWRFQIASGALMYRLYLDKRHSTPIEKSQDILEDLLFSGEANG